MTSNVSKNHHYVPQWYQKLFLPQGCGEFFVLDKHPNLWVTDKLGKRRRIKSPKSEFRSGTNALFSQENFHSVKLPGHPPDIVETHLFGPLDNMGSKAIKGLLEWPETRHFGTRFQVWESYPYKPDEVILGALDFIDIQRSRTRKGLCQIEEKYKPILPSIDNTKLMALLERHRRINCTVWSECIWEIFRSEPGAPPFILSETPINIYNSKCFPLSHHCRFPSEPNPFWQGSRVIYPLSPNRLLVLSHPEWVDDPASKRAKIERRNARVFEGSIIKWDSHIANYRSLDVQSVTAINWAIKALSPRLIASAERSALYPENFIKKPNWPEIDRLFHPEFKTAHSKSSMLARFNDGSIYSNNAFGEEVHVPSPTARSRSGNH